MGCALLDMGSKDEEDTSTQAKTSGAATLTLEKPAAVGRLLVTLLQVKDSRCPKDATCVWYGNVVTTVQLQDAAGRSVQQKLYLGGALPAPNDRGFRSADSVAVAVGGKRYLVVLQEVQPFPTAADPNPVPKTARVTVRPL